jgi:hypothetical protein
MLIESGFVVTICFLGILGFVPRIPKTPLHRSVLSTAMSALWDSENAATQKYRDLTTNQLLAGYQRLANSPAYRRDPHYWGTCRNCNLIYFILETGAAKFLPADDPMEDLPNLRRLTVYRQVTETIARMAALQEVLATRRSQGDSLRNHFYDQASH